MLMNIDFFKSERYYITTAPYHWSPDGNYNGTDDIVFYMYDREESSGISVGVVYGTAPSYRELYISNDCEITGGHFYDGAFHGGTFTGGEFKHAVIYGGEFHGGIFENGINIFGGTYYGGIFQSGLLFDGSYHSGRFNGEVVISPSTFETVDALEIYGGKFNLHQSNIWGDAVRTGIRTGVYDTC